jgi:DNA-binding CsgD family transcriptional regulator/PAS domain-containing protein
VSQALTSTKVTEQIGNIYDCAIDPGQWSQTLAHLLVNLDFTTAAFSVRLYPSGRSLLTYTAGVAPHWLAQAKQYDHEVPILWGGLEKYLQLPLDGVHVSTALSEKSDRDKLAFIKDWAEPQGLIDKVALILARNSQSLGRLALGRHVDQGPVGQTDIDNCLLLLPHLQRSVAISQLLDAQTLAAASFEAAFDVIATPVVIVDRNLSIIHANSAAQVMLPKAAHTNNSSAVLRLQQPMAHRALAAAVEQGAENEATLGRRGFGIPANDANGNPMVVHVLPLRFGAMRRQLISKAAAAIFFATPATSPEAPQEALAALYDLTHTEAKVLTLVADGHSRNEIADLLGVGLSTIKTHLLHLNSKTGSARQSDLAKLARSLSVPI